MVIAQDLGAVILGMVEQRQECDMEELTSHCPQATWNQVFLALDKLSREGQVALRQQGPGRYKIGPAPQGPAGGRISPQQHN